MRATAFTRLAQRGKDLNDDIPSEIPKPYTTPPGFKPPTLGEQWRYAVMKHPYYRYGYSAAILLGLIGYGIATSEKKDHQQAHGKHNQEASSNTAK